MGSNAPKEPWTWKDYLWFGILIGFIAFVLFGMSLGRPPGKWVAYDVAKVEFIAGGAFSSDKTVLRMRDGAMLIVRSGAFPVPEGPCWLYHDHDGRVTRWEPRKP